MNKKLIDLIAKWIFIADHRWEVENALYEKGVNYDIDEINDEIEILWKKCLKALKEEPWSNGRHHGDCTQLPVTCFRCMIEDYYRRAREEIVKNIGEIDEKNTCDWK